MGKAFGRKESGRNEGLDYLKNVTNAQEEKYSGFGFDTHSAEKRLG